MPLHSSVTPDANKTEASRRSRWWIWAAVSLILYIGSESPLRHWCQHHGYGVRRITTTTIFTADGGSFPGEDIIEIRGAPAWHESIFRLVNWMNLYSLTPMRKYDEMWARVFP